MWETLEREILPFVDKPARYIGGEQNSVIKDHRGKTSVCLIYPDVYEIGISNIGLKILYHILNTEKNIVCERAYAPWPDMEEKLREKKLPLYSLETKKPLSGFDILGFTFQYELLYTNFLNILDLSQIPLYAKDRGAVHPFIIGGGPVSGNLEPVAPFLDAICIGDGESRVLCITKAVTASKKKGKSRIDILKDLSLIDGVYVPLLYETKEENGFIIPVGPKVRRFSEPELSDKAFTTAQILPNLQAVQDRAVVEVARGCTRGCRFCQAGMLYRPLRERSVSSILKLTREIINNTGYRELSLISLSISDYSDLNTLIEALDKQLSPHGVSFSLPSLRIDSFNLELAQKVKEIRKSGLTFAVEGGTQILRDAINKNVSEDELIKVIQIAKNLGWRSVKLYFMIGLCSIEKGAEIEGIARLAEKIDSLVKGIKFTISIALFIPKAHTPFQWNAQMRMEDASDDFHNLIRTLRSKRNINIRFHEPDMSHLEGIFSRGDRRLAKAVELAFQKGARFDGWSDHFNYGKWKEAFEEAGINPGFYLQAKDPQKLLPWEHIDSGITKKYLLKEREKSLQNKTTGDCRDACHDFCGSCDFRNIKPRPAKKRAGEKIKLDKGFLNKVLIGNSSRFLCRFLYSKTGLMKYIGPIDLEEIFVRAFIRANIPVVFTKGYNPHIRVEMGWALPIGFSSLYETAEIELAGAVNEVKLLKKLNKELPSGLKFIRFKVLKMPAAKLSKTGKEHSVQFSFNKAGIEDKVSEVLNYLGEFKKITSKKEKVINLKEYLTQFEIKESRAYVTFIQKEGGARIQDFITALTGYDTRRALILDPCVKKRFLMENGKQVLLFDL